MGLSFQLIIPPLAGKSKSDACGGSQRLLFGGGISLDVPHVQLQTETADVEVEVLGGLLFLEFVNVGLGLMDGYVFDLASAVPLVVGPRFFGDEQ
jgi:hypothetical protein